MSQFEIITITLSVVLGLSMSHLLWAAASAVRSRRNMRLHWLPFAWAAGIFFVHVQYWFAAFAIDLIIDGWTWSWYLQILFLGVLLFASGALILPSESLQRVGELIEDFRQHGRLALIPLAGYFILWIPMSYRIDGATFDAGNIANLILTLLVVGGIYAKRSLIQSVMVILFSAVLIWASVFVWAQSAL